LSSYPAVIVFSYLFNKNIAMQKIKNIVRYCIRF